MNYKVKSDENVIIHWDFCEWQVTSIYVEQGEIESVCGKYKDGIENKWVYEEDIDVNELDYESIRNLQNYIKKRNKMAKGGSKCIIK